MSWRTDVTYEYDGSFEGLMCCVFESFDKKEELVDIRSAEEPQYSLFAGKYIETYPGKADRVYAGIGRKISPAAQRMVRLGFLTCAKQKELLIYRFLRLGFKHGAAVMSMLAEDDVHLLQRAVRRLEAESHKLLGFVRFSVYNQVLGSVIEPENEVLPVMAAHFCERFRNESFMIYDKTHGKALIYRPAQFGQAARAEIVEADELVLPEADETEIAYRSLWKQFYDTVAIKERISPRRRMSLMPKRYWSHLTELAENEACDKHGANASKRLQEIQEIQEVREDSPKAIK